MEPIPSHKTYGATREGKIFDLRTEQERLPQLDGSGYKKVMLKNKDGYKSYSVARLIGETFLPNSNNLPQIDHINRNRQDNRVENLRWASLQTQSENKVGFGKYKRYIYYESYPPYECWTIQIKNAKLKYKKRYDSRLYTFDEVLTERNNILTEYQIPITD